MIISDRSAGVAEVIIGGHDKIREGEAQDYVLTLMAQLWVSRIVAKMAYREEVYSPGDEMLVRADNLEEGSRWRYHTIMGVSISWQARERALIFILFRYRS